MRRTEKLGETEPKAQFPSKGKGLDDDDDPDRWYTELKQFCGLPYSQSAWCYSYGQKAAKWELHILEEFSHFRTKIMLKTTEHTSPSDTGINIHYND